MNSTFKVIIGVSASVYAFLSGLLISVAMSAASSIAFAADPNSYHASALAIGPCAFLAGIFWFILSERIAAHNRKIERQIAATVRATQKSVIQVLPLSEKTATLAMFAFASVLSIFWPFIRLLWPCGE